MRWTALGWTLSPYKSSSRAKGRRAAKKVRREESCLLAGSANCFGLTVIASDFDGAECGVIEDPLAVGFGQCIVLTLCLLTAAGDSCAPSRKATRLNLSIHVKIEASRYTVYGAGFRG